MEEFVSIIVKSGTSAVNLSLYTLLPVMVVLMAFMRVLEAKKILYIISKALSPVLKLFGIHGLGAFAMLQTLFIGFAAPISTLAIMAGKSYSRKELAAVFAMILAMSQANAVFPLLTVGLEFDFTLVSSLIGGIVAASTTYYIFTRSMESADGHAEAEVDDESDKKLLPLLVEGGQRGMQIVAQSVPMLMLALFAVNVFNSIGLIGLAEKALSPLTDLMQIPSIAVLPFLTKYLAGGTAMMGVSLDLVGTGKMTSLELNRIAGWMINPLDLVGIGLYMSAGPKTASIAKIAIPGALIGIAVRGFLHFVFF